MGGISGNTQNTDNVFFEDAETEFSRTFYELGGQIEFNFLPYSDKFAYLQTSRIAPYTFGGFGFTYASGEKSFFSPNLSVGVGVKYKIKNRINLGLEYSFRKLFSDSFDSPNKEGFNLDDPYNVKSGFLKNKDWYSIFMFSITWDFGPNDRACNNNLQ
jgi:opacity protein-like surface antigen